jgi:predicted AAA+ superfamily ATPase
MHRKYREEAINDKIFSVEAIAMKKFHDVYPREKYLKGIRPFYKSDVIKIVTGIRRCGKSYLMRAIINELLDLGTDPARIVYVPLDKRGFKSIKTADQLEKRIESMLADDDFHYLIVDEVQNVKGFEPVVQAFAEEGFSVFLTGSNSYLLSDEISTKLTGRYLSFEVFPLDFAEYLEMKKFRGRPVGDDLDSEFDEYLLNGGFPKSLEFDDVAARQFYTRGIIEEIFDKDVRTRNRISNKAVFERVQSFLINNYAKVVSVPSIVKSLSEQGISTTARTVRKYIADLQKAKIVFECNRFDLKSKKSLSREQKYYLADLSLYFSTNTDNRLSYGPSLENIVYLYLISNGYSVSVGKIGKLECDFISRDPEGQYAYIQVTYSLQGGNEEATEKLKEREYRPFRSIRDGYPRYIISLDRHRDQQEGVHHINAIDLFLGRVRI